MASLPPVPTPPVEAPPLDNRPPLPPVTLNVPPGPVAPEAPRPPCAVSPPAPAPIVFGLLPPHAAATTRQAGTKRADNRRFMSFPSERTPSRMRSTPRASRSTLSLLRYPYQSTDWGTCKPPREDCNEHPTA